MNRCVFTQAVRDMDDGIVAFSQPNDRTGDRSIGRDDVALTMVESHRLLTDGQFDDCRFNGFIVRPRFRRRQALPSSKPNRHAEASDMF